MKKEIINLIVDEISNYITNVFFVDYDFKEIIIYDASEIDDISFTNAIYFRDFISGINRYKDFGRSYFHKKIKTNVFEIGMGEQEFMKLFDEVVEMVNDKFRMNMEYKKEPNYIGGYRYVSLKIGQ